MTLILPKGYLPAPNGFSGSKSIIEEIDVVRVPGGSNTFYVMGRTGKYRHEIEGFISNGSIIKEVVFRQDYRKPFFLFPGGKKTSNYDHLVKLYKENNMMDLGAKTGSSEPVNI